MELTYNGITFEILRIYNWLREFQTTEDGAQILYDHNVIQATCWLSSGATDPSKIGLFRPAACPTNIGPNYTNPSGLSGSTRLNPPKAPGKSVLTSIPKINNDPGSVYNAIFQNLAVTPGNLTITFGGVTILQSPLDGMTIDARYGPQCKMCGLNSVGGISSLVLDLQFETWLPFCTTTNPPPLILANRWSVQSSYDEQYFATHVYEGEAVFNMAMLTGFGVVPDMYRNWLVPPPAPNFQRKQPTFELMSGGESLRYQVTDEECRINFPAGAGMDQSQRVAPNTIPVRASMIEVLQTQNYEGSNWKEVLPF